MESDKNTYKAFRVVRELENRGICHEYFDVLDYDVETILSWYGIIEKWNEEERKILKEYLLQMAYEDEIKEIVRLVEQEFDPVISSIPDRAAPCPRILELEHEVWKNEMEKKRQSVENQKDSQLLCEVKK